MINYIFTLFRTQNRYLNTFLTVIFIAPFNMIGLVVSILPQKKELYLTNIITIKKKVINLRDNQQLFY
jgi:hypothetical protein